jgi:hypothetical protein
MNSKTIAFKRAVENLLRGMLNFNVIERFDIQQVIEAYDKAFEYMTPRKSAI